MNRVGNRIAIDPWQVYVTIQCDEARMRQLGCEPLAGLEGNRAVLPSMYDQRFGADARKRIYGIHLAAQAQQLRRLRRICPVALVSGEILRFLRRCAGQEYRRQRHGSKAPVRLREIIERIPQIRRYKWLTLGIGLWLAACPWILGFHGDTMAMQVHFAVGVVVATIAIVELWILHHTPPHERA